MTRTTARALPIAAVLIAAVLAGPFAAARASVTRSASDRSAASTSGDRETTAPHAAGRTGARQSASPPRPVIVIGVPGLTWAAVSAGATPAIWDLARRGSAGALILSTISKVTCPGDAWLTLDSGFRSAQATGACRPLPPVARAAGQAGAVAAGTVPALAGLEAFNTRFAYIPAKSDWGDLARSAGHAGCATAIGPGAALALARADGAVSRYAPSLAVAGAASLRACPLTIVDLGTAESLPGARAQLTSTALHAVDQQVAEVVAAAPAGARILLAGLGDGGTPHFGVLIAAGPGFAHGVITSTSTRQPGFAPITDLPSTIMSWLGQAPPAALPGAVLTSSARQSLPGAIAGWMAQDTADQVYWSTLGWFFLILGFSEALLFAVIAVTLRGADARRTRLRVAGYTAAAVFTAAIPAGTFLANLLPWARWPHPAVALYGIGLGWAALIGAVALLGPWRRDPWGPVGFVAAVTAGVIGIDVMTGSRLQLGTPFGLNLLEAGRFYGVGNNAIGVYASAGLLTAAWAGVTMLRSDRVAARRLAVLVAAAVAVLTVIASGWPGFGAKVGGTIAMVPAFGVLLFAIAGRRIGARSGVLIAVSGLVLVAVFGLLDFAATSLIGPSHLGSFTGDLLRGHSGALATLNRKISSNIRSLYETWYTPVVPVVMLGAGLLLFWPDRLGLRAFARARARDRMLRPVLVAVWLAGVLVWLADDSGVSTAAAALPLALPLAIALTARLAAAPRDAEAVAPEAVAPEAVAPEAVAPRAAVTRAGDPHDPGWAGASDAPGGR